MADYTRLGEAIGGLFKGTSQPGDLGFVVDGVFRVVDPEDPRRFFVRFQNGTFVSALHKNRVLQKPGMPVLVGTDRLGNPVILGADPSRIDQFLGGNSGGAEVGLHDHTRNSGREFIIDPWLIKRLRLTVVSGYIVQISAGAYLYNRTLKWWTDDTIDLTAFVPSADTEDCWVIVGIDPETETIVALSHAPQIFDSTADPSLIALVQFVEFGYIPIGAVYVRGSTTELYNYLIEDLRFLPGEMVSFLEDLRNVSASSNYYGYVLGYVNGEWVGVPQTGGSGGSGGTGGINVNTRVVTAAGAVTLTSADYVVIVNKTVGAATVVNLPASPTDGDAYIIKDGKGDAATNNLTLTPNTGNIDGASTYVMDINYESISIVRADSQWLIV